MCLHLRRSLESSTRNENTDSLHNPQVRLKFGVHQFYPIEEILLLPCTISPPQTLVFPSPSLRSCFTHKYFGKTLTFLVARMRVINPVKKLPSKAQHSTTAGGYSQSEVSR